MASRLDEFLKNASPEVRAAVVKTAQNIDKHHQSLKSEDNPGFKDVSGPSGVPGRTDGLLRPEAGAPVPSHGPSDQQPERRIDQAINQKAKAQAIEHGNEAVKNGVRVEKAPPTKEPER